VLATLRTVLTGFSDVWVRRRAERRHARMLSVIEGQILPRLVIATGNAQACGCACDCDPTSDDVAELSRLLIEHDATVAGEYLQVLRTQGASVESLWMQLVAPAARHLHQLAASGAVDPKQIETAQHSLHILLHDLEVRHERERPRATQAVGEFSHGG
jgi:hypothetical protein